MRTDLKWHGYEPTLAVRYIEEAFSLVEEDALACSLLIGAQVILLTPS